MTLVLHSGAEPIEYKALTALAVPAPTATHVPIPHHRIVDTVRHMLSFFGHFVTEESHGVTEDGARYFGLLNLKSNYGDWTDMLGLRNSHDRTMPIGIAFGSRVFVCDNMSFVADHVIRRKHTLNAKHDLPALISALVEPLADQRLAQFNKLSAYKQRALTDRDADHLVLQAYRSDIVNLQRVPDVLDQWEHPAHDWGPKSVWRLFNAFTFTLNGKVAERPVVTQTLHSILDSCLN